MYQPKKSIPKSLKECYATDIISSNLWDWSEWLEKWGRKLLIFLIFIGIISTIADAIEMGNLDDDLVLITVITSSISWALYAFIEYCAYRALSLLIASLATIVQNTKVSANIALYKAAQEEGFVEEEETKSSAFSYGKSISSTPKGGNSHWQCDACGTYNNSSVSICENCGTRK